MKAHITKFQRVYFIAGLIFLQNCATSQQEQVQNQNGQAQENENTQADDQAQEMSFDNEGDNVGDDSAINDTSENNFAWGNDQAVDQGAAVNSDASNEFLLASDSETVDNTASNNEFLQNPVALASTNTTIPQNMPANLAANAAMAAPQGDPLGPVGDMVPAGPTTVQTSYESVLNLPKCGI